MENDIKSVNNTEANTSSQEPASIYPSPKEQRFTPSAEGPSVVTIDNDSREITLNEPAIPYLASLGACVLLLISTFYSLITLIDYMINHLIGKKIESTDSFSSYLGNFDQYVALGAIAALTISLPAMAFLVFIVRKYEESEIWRFRQKWRRVIYSIGAIVLIFGIVGSLGNMIYDVLTNSLGINETQSYSYLASEAEKSKTNTGEEITKAVLSGLIGSVLMGLGLFTLGSEYANKRRGLFWITVAVVAVIAIATSIYTINDIHQSVQDQKKKQNSSQQQTNPFDNESTFNTNNSDVLSESNVAITKMNASIKKVHHFSELMVLNKTSFCS
jgi:large-conductance mechanosensitive channel